MRRTEPLAQRLRLVVEAVEGVTPRALVQLGEASAVAWTSHRVGGAVWGADVRGWVLTPLVAYPASGVCEEEPECSTNVDCDDGVECTDDVCDDCYGCDNFVNCWDDDECTDDRCDPDTGGCYYPPSPDGTYCECLEWEWRDCWFVECLWGPGDYYCSRYGRCQSGACI